MKYYVITGEASGDMHASKLVREIKKLDPDSSFRCWGGDLLIAEGAEVVKHYRDLAFMGFLEVLLNIRTIFRNFKFCKTDILAYNPDVIILVDYPGFNMRVAKWAHKEGKKVFYYIAPQVWAWNQGRVHKIHRDVDHAFVILPFEKDFHARFGYKVDFCGHPLTDTIFEPGKETASGFRENTNIDDRPIIALIPGSRKQEIHHILPEMLAVMDDFPGYQYIIGGVSTLDPKLYAVVLKNREIPVVYNQTYDLLLNAKAAIVKSGTSTLETALLGTPQVVVYRTSFISALLAWIFVKVKYISLVNLILNREAVKELVQYDLNRRNLSAELAKLLNDEPYRSAMKDSYRELESMLGRGGTSIKAAKLMVDYLLHKNGNPDFIPKASG